MLIRQLVDTRVPPANQEHESGLAHIGQRDADLPVDPRDQTPLHLAAEHGAEKLGARAQDAAMSEDGLPVVNLSIQTPSGVLGFRKQARQSLLKRENFEAG